MREQLIGYILGALDEAEERALERRLADDPMLRMELEEVRRELQTLNDVDTDVEPPPDLSCRTLAHIESQRRAPVGDASFSHPSPRWVDVATTSLVCLVSFALFFTSLVNARFRVDVEGCQYNLRVIGVQLIGYSNTRSDHSFPKVEPYGNMSFAGANAVILAEQGYFERRPSYLVCPGSGRDWSEWEGIPQSELILEAEGATLARLRADAGGSFAWLLGQLIDGTYRAPRNHDRSDFCIGGDAPSYSQRNLASQNHAGFGFNVLYEDGHVKFFRCCDGAFCHDDPFRNRHGNLAPGVAFDDSVVAESSQTPFDVDVKLPRCTRGIGSLGQP